MDCTGDRLWLMTPHPPRRGDLHRRVSILSRVLFVVSLQLQNINLHHSSCAIIFPAHRVFQKSKDQSILYIPILNLRFGIYQAANSLLPI